MAVNLCNMTKFKKMLDKQKKLCYYYIGSSNYTKFEFCLIGNKKKKGEYNMELYVIRKTSQKGKRYLALVAVAEWGEVILSFDEGRILQILPQGVNHREITEKGVKIGSIDE